MSTRLWGTEKLVNTITAGNQDHSSIAALNDGGYVVVWQDNSTADAAIRGQRFDAFGNKAGGEIEIIEQPGNDSSVPSVTGLADGGFYVNWTFNVGINNYILGSVYDANGAFVRSQEAIFAFGLDHDSQTARLGTSSVVTWSDPDSTQGDILFRIFDSAGTGGTLLTANTTTTGRQSDASMDTSPSGGGIAIVWYDDNLSAIRGQTFDGTGNKFLPEFTVVSSSPSLSLGDPPDVTWLNDTQFVVVWNDTPLNRLNADIRAKIFDIGGGAAVVTAVTGDLLVNSVTSEYQNRPAVTALKNGGFAVVWEDSSNVNGDPTKSIQIQVFDGAGGKIGGQLLVNTTINGVQEFPKITDLVDGRLALSWTDFSSGNADIRTQIVDPRDGAVNGTSGIDKLLGHDGAVDTMRGFDGADTIYGLGGADTILGGGGIDNLYGGRGDDTVYGEADNDILYGDLGDDEQYGGDGNDIIYSAGGADLLDGGAGTGDAAFYVNELLGATVNLTDQLLTAGSALGDTLFNFERVYGSVRGANNLTGDSNANILVGGLVNDTLSGGGNADVLRGWGGVDTMSGGLGNDIFQYTGNTEGGDIITDFAAGDKFQFVRTAFGNLAGANVAAVNFLSVASGHAATTASQRFIFDQATKQLWYDANGNTAGGDVMIADLSTSYNILNTDLLLA